MYHTRMTLALRRMIERPAQFLKKRANLWMWMLCFLWVILLLWLSSEDGPATARTSGRLAALVVRLLGLPSAKLTQVDTLLRTLAHFGGFFVLGALAYSAARLTWPGVGRIGLYVFLACGAMAMLDEVKKVFIPGRHLSWSEAGLNALGALCGVLVVWGIFRLAGRCKAKAR